MNFRRRSIDHDSGNGGRAIGWVIEGLDTLVEAIVVCGGVVCACEDDKVFGLD